MSTKISVVIATYKRPLLLIKCLNALAAQTCQKEDFEVIAVSDGPDAETASAIKSWNSTHTVQLKHLTLIKKKGPAGARNYGWINAKSPLIAFTDDDCLPDENWLATYVNASGLKPGCVFTGKTIVPVNNPPTDYEKNISGLASADFITANCCCPKITLKLVGGFDERFSMAWREDSDLEFKLISAGIQIIKTDQAVITHPVRISKWGVSIGDQKKTLFNALLYKKFHVLYRQKIQPVPPYSYYFTILSFLVMLTGMIYQSVALTLTGVMIWLFLTIIFVYRRLKGTSKSAPHVTEMIVTSAVIPFLSIYWQWYGCLKYKTILV